MLKRFFKATAQNGYLHPWGPKATGLFDPSAIEFQTEEEVAWMMRVGAGHHSQVNTTADLDHALVASRSVPISITLYVDESLLDEVKRRIEG